LASIGGTIASVVAAPRLAGRSRRGDRGRRRSGFTLVELLITVVVIAILAAIAVPRYVSFRRRAYLATLRNDLRVLSIQQELYHQAHGTYTNTAALADFQESPGVQLNLTGVTTEGWAATATHTAVPGAICAIFMGTDSATDAPPATEAGKIACTEE
jgi:prepilin-type N-terminal cleavage/methylation domain-containing protein